MSTSPEPAERKKPSAQDSRAARAGRLLGRSVLKAKEAMASPTVRAAGKKAATRAASAAASRYSAGATGHAGRLLRNKDKLLTLASRGDHVVGGMETGSTSGIAGEAKALLRLIRAYATGEYRDVPFETMVPVVAAMVYVVSPLDVIPEFIPGVGHLDDAAVLTHAVKLVRGELDKFLAWEQETGRRPPSLPALDAGSGPVDGQGDGEEPGP